MAWWCGAEGGRPLRPRRLVAEREHSQRQVLHGEVRVALGAFDPACRGGIVGEIEFVGHGKVAFGNPAQQAS